MPPKQVPRDLEQLFDRPGGRWSEDERDRVRQWLLAPPQFNYLLYTAGHLVAGDAKEAEDALRGWFYNHLARVIQAYDPDQGPHFWSYHQRSAQGYLLDCLRRDLSPYRVPDEFVALFQKPGIIWTPAERAGVQEWLNRDPQRRSALNLARNNGARTSEEAEDFWHTWNDKRYDKVVNLYDPSKDPDDPGKDDSSFWSYHGRYAHGFVPFCFRRECWKMGQTEQRRAAPLDSIDETRLDQNDEAKENEIEGRDILNDPDLAAMVGTLLALINEALTSLRDKNERHYTAFVEYHLEGYTIGEIAVKHNWLANSATIWRKRGAQFVLGWFRTHHPDFVPYIERITRSERLEEQR